jgi:nucleoside-diphosphate-sugar epimerase
MVSKALVIGGTLFIGRAMVSRLLDRGDDVTILHRTPGTPFGDAVDEVLCDRNDVAAVRSALGGRRFDVVIDNVYDFGRGTTAAQVAAAAEVTAPGLRRYVFTSSVAAYGGGLDHDEDDPLPADHPNPYSRDKAGSERALFRLHAEHGLPVVTLRPAYVYGPGNPFYREAFFWDLMRTGRPVVIPDDGTRLMQFAHKDDVARAALLALNTDVGVGRSYNLGGEPAVTQVEYVRALARAAGAEPEMLHVPRAAIEAAGGSLFRPNLYFGEYYDLPSLTVRSGRARTELGLDLVPLDDGLSETFRWYDSLADRPPHDHGWYDDLVAGIRSAY